MTDRFRLTYLKSTDLGKPDFEESFSSHDQPKMARSPSLPVDDNPPETLSSETILKQAKADLKHPDPKVRVLAIRYYLEKSYPAIPISILQEILSDPDAEVRAEALRCLIKFRNPIVAPLLKKYLKDNDPRVRIATLRAMFQHQEKLDLNVLLQFLSDESTWVRRKIATLLGWSQVEGALPILMEMSRDPDPMVRKAALFSLATLYPDEGENRLIEAMTDSDTGLRKWAKVTLERIVARPLKKRTASLSKRG
ncbi:MAG TPA: HEAT repeat domain-containing protein [Thermodesulfobacteriota bacterium]|nr:HEAT repeat domain-containing protein [Thermodesulfobacteriota bacterium]